MKSYFIPQTSIFNLGPERLMDGPSNISNNAGIQGIITPGSEVYGGEPS